MGLSKLRRFDVQAKTAFALALISVCPCVAGAYLLVRNYHHELGQVVYRGDSYFFPAFLVCLIASLAPSAIAFLLGLSSAGQRRNDRPTRSWIGFFVGGLIATVDLVLLLAFLMLRFQQPI